MIDPNEFPRRRLYPDELENKRIMTDAMRDLEESAKRLDGETQVNIQVPTQGISWYGLPKDKPEPTKRWDELSPDMREVLLWMRKIIQEEREEEKPEELEEIRGRLTSLETQLILTRRALKTFLLYNIAQTGFKPVVGAEIPTEEIASVVESAATDWEDMADLFGE